MLYLLPVAALRQGMFVVDIAVHWHKHDKLYSTEGIIRSIEQLDAIKLSGFTEAYVDLKKSQPGCLPPGLEEFLAPFKHDPFQQSGFTQQAGFHEECIVANTLYSDSLKLAREMEQDARHGRIDVDGAQPVIEDMYHSLKRNHDALIGLSKLRKTDEYTYTHSINVAIFSILFAKALGASEQAILKIGAGALFHDIGKHRIPNEIINAPRKLTPEEFAIMKKHPELGADILDKMKKHDPSLAVIAKTHHEKYNGKGYPDRLCGSDIPTEAALVGITDVFDALTSERSYKLALPLNQALSILYSQRGEAFAPTLVDRFIRLLGVFPLGTVVLLNDQRAGIVCQTSRQWSVRPKVKILFDAKGRRTLPEEVDLGTEPALKIERTIPAHTMGISPADELNLPRYS